MKVSASNLDSKILGVKAIAEKQNQTRHIQTPSFGGTTKISAELTKDINAHIKWLPKGLEWLERHNGEILNAVVTAIGTACVAPIFIAFNPFSKEDKETRTYSAWRQPISAVLALAAQYGITAPYNNHVDKLASTGKFDRANLTAKPDAGYLKRVIKAENPGHKFTKQELADAVKTRQDNAMWAAINKARIEHAGRPLNVEEYIDDVAREAAKKEIEKEFKDELSKMKDKARNKFIEQKLPEKAKKFAIEQVEESTAIKFKASQLATEAKAKGMSFENLITSVEKQLAEFSGNAGEKSLLSKALEKLRCYEKYENMKYLGFSETQIRQSVKIKKMIMAQIQEAEKVLKGYKTHTGIVVTLFTLPFSCGLLNWVYPRLMEIIMPQKKNKQLQTQQVDNFKKNAALQGKEGK